MLGTFYDTVEVDRKGGATQILRNPLNLSQPEINLWLVYKCAHHLPHSIGLSVNT